MAAKEFFSTGEAAKLLNISRSTISRKFDLGILFGKRNPITGERFVSRESLQAFMKLYNVFPETFILVKRVLVSTPDNSLFSLIKEASSGEGRLQIERLGANTDVLNGCLKEHPDLLIVDEESSDLSCAEIIRSLQKKEELKDLKILCCSRSPDTHRLFEMGAHQVLPREAVDTSRLKKVISALLDLHESAFEAPQPFEHRRQWPRATVHLPSKVWIYRVRTPYLRDTGEAQIENISCGGAFLSGIHPGTRVIPCEPFRIFLKVDQGPLKNWKAHGRVVRLQSNGGSLAAGVQFTRLSKSNLRMIEALTSMQEEGEDLPSPSFPQR